MKRIITLLFFVVVYNNFILGQNRGWEISSIGLSSNLIIDDGLEYPVLAKINLNTVLVEKVNIRFSLGKYGKSELINENMPLEQLISISGHTVAISSYVDFLKLGPCNLKLGGGLLGGNCKSVRTKSNTTVSFPSELIILHDLGYTNEYGLGLEFFGGMECKITSQFSLDVHLGTYSMSGIEQYGKFYYTGITLNYLIHHEKNNKN